MESSIQPLPQFTDYHAQHSHGHDVSQALNEIQLEQLAQAADNPPPPKPPPVKWQAFMFGIYHKHKDYVLSSMKELGSLGQYIIGLEVCDPPRHKLTNGQHFHFMAQMTDKDYTRFLQRMIKHFELRGKSDMGEARQYGKVHKIRNEVKMKAYSVKDGNVITNLSEKELDELRAISCEKTERKKFRQKLYDYLNKRYLEWFVPNIDPHQYHPEQHDLHIGKLPQLIIKFYKENYKENGEDLSLSRSNIISIMTSFMMYHSITPVDDFTIQTFLGHPQEYI